MSRYKRLTNNNRDEYDPEYDFCCDCKYFGEPCGCNKPNGTCDNYDRFLETYNRLAELENKIENGTLIELPCKIGDTVYFVNRYRPTPRIEKFSVSYLEVTAYEQPVVVVCYNNDCTRKHARYSFQFPDKDVFFTEAEAETRLRELLKEINEK